MKIFVKLALLVSLFGGYAFADFERKCKNIAWGVVQLLSPLDSTYSGRRVWIVAEKYGADLSSGFKIYLAYRTSNSCPSATKWTNRGDVYDLNELPYNRDTYFLLAPHIEDAKEALDGFQPKYLD